MSVARASLLLLMCLLCAASFFDRRASQGGHIKVVQTLLQHNGDPNVVAADDGCSPITMAASKNARRSTNKHMHTRPPT